MDIRGLGPAIVSLLLSANLIKDPSDLYFLKKEDLVSLERMGEKSASNLIEAIQNSKKQPLNRLIYALGIPLIGSKASLTLAQEFKTMDRLQNATHEELTQIPEIGDKMAQSIIAFFAQEQTKRMIQRLKEAGVNMTYEEKAGPKPLENLTFVLTGALEKYSRAEAQAIIESLGGNVTSSVSKKTDYVVVGKDPGSKYTKALELGVKILNEEEFEELISKAK